MPPKEPRQVGMPVEPPWKRRRAEIVAETTWWEEKAWQQATTMGELVAESLAMVNEAEARCNELELQVLDLQRKLDMKGEAALVSRKTVLALVEKYLEEEANEADVKSGTVEKQPEKCQHGPRPWSKTVATQTEGQGAEKDGDDDWGTWKGSCALGSTGNGYGCGYGYYDGSGYGDGGSNGEWSSWSWPSSSKEASFSFYGTIQGA